MVLVVLMGVSGGRRMMGVARGVRVDVASSRSVVARRLVVLLLLRRVRVVVPCVRVVVPCVRVVVACVRVVVACVRVVVTRRVMALLLLRMRVVVVGGGGGGGMPVLVVVLLLLVGLRRRQAGPGRLPVRQRRVHQVVDRLEQVLDAVRRRDPGVAQVRDELRRDVVDGHVGHRLAALGRGQGAGHLVLEEAGEGGGHGPVALRVGDPLVLFFFFFW